MYLKFIALLHLRICQIWRLIRSVGAGLLLVFLVISTGIIFPLVDNILKLPQSMSVAGAILILGMADYSRKDKIFLRPIFQSRRILTLYIFIEYSLLTSPLWIFQCIQGNLYGILILLSCAVAGWLSPMYFQPLKATSKKSIPFISLEYFEAKFHLEKHPIFWVFFWLLSLSGILHIGFYLAWVFVLILSLPEMFRPFEAREMIHWHNRYVLKKIIRYLLFFTIATIIPITLTFIMHPEMYALLIYSYLSLITGVALNLVIKYSTYTPVFHAGYMTNVTGILSFILLIPGGILITLGFIIWKYFHAEKNIKHIYA